MEKKKAWAKPEIRRLAITDELLELIARNASAQAPMPVKRLK
jgi:hypothetical protein